ncbi:MAG: DNA polymerase III subunit beta [Candidatus Latescibacteria bacterium]|nr:DNA polymerase III subunit beta [Candidatus Latescibacterota bacterium]
MKVVIERNVLFDGLQRVFSVVPQKPTLPILTNFLLKTSEGKLSISGTDMDISITTTLECEVEGEITVTVDAKRFLNIIRELPEGNITIEIEDDRVMVNFVHGESSIMGITSADYPALRHSVDGLTISVSGDDFIEMVDRTSFSVAVDRTRLALTGVYWKVSSDDVTMVATDGHRLSLYRKKITFDEGQEAESIVPPKALNQASKIVSSGISLVKVIFGEGVILFDFGNTTIFSKLIEGPYPNFWQVIPANNSKKVYVSTEDFAAAVRRVSVLSNAITHQIQFNISSGTIELMTKNADIGGEAKETVAAKYNGDSVQVGYNASFLGEILRKIDTDEVILELENPTTACIIRPVNSEESEEYLYLIMPLRLGE